VTGRLVDLFMLYQFLKRLATPFEKWDAYKLGIIDKQGNILKSRKDFETAEERDALRLFDVVVLNLKKLIGKVPGGKTQLATYAAALLLLREDTETLEQRDVEHLFEYYLEEAEQTSDDINQLFEQIIEDAPVMSVGSGSVQGIGHGPKGEPGLTPAMMRRYKMKNAMVYMTSPDKYDMYKKKTYEEFVKENNIIGAYPTFIQNEVTGALHYLGQ
jgi:hypothetical protein